MAYGRAPLLELLSPPRPPTPLPLAPEGRGGAGRGGAGRALQYEIALQIQIQSARRGEARRGKGFLSVPTAAAAAIIF